MKSALKLICLWLWGGFLFAANEGSAPVFIQSGPHLPDKVQFSSGITGGKVFAESNCLTYALFNPNQVKSIHDQNNPVESSNQWIDAHAFQVIFLGANQGRWSGQNQLPGLYNYFIGNNPDHWAQNRKSYKSLKNSEIYPGTDLVLTSDDAFLKYQFELEPHADPSLIRLKYSGTDNLFIQDKRLIIKTSVGDFIELEPYAYQINSKGQQVKVACDFSASDSIVKFEFPQGYNLELPLVIDPTLIFSSYTGGTSDNWGFTAAPDNYGNLVSGALSFGLGYPITLGSYQVNFGGTEDMAISKFNSNGTNLIFSTYIGGAQDDRPHSIIVDKNNDVIIFGTTTSNNFPVTVGAYDGSYNGGFDIVVVKLNSNGSILEGSTYLGGSSNDGLNQIPLAYNYGDSFRGEVITDPSGNIYIGANTLSNDFPVTSGVFQPIIGNNEDGCIVKFSPDLTQVIFSSYLGDSNMDAVFGITLGTGGKIYVTGGTNSDNLFNGLLGPTYQNTRAGDIDAFIAIVSADGDSILQGTYLGTGAYDQAYFIETDKAGKIYVLGQTKGNFPVSSGVYSNPSGGLFITRFDSQLLTLDLSTVIGSVANVPNVSPTAFLVDNCGQVYVAGWGGLNNTGSTIGLPVTSDALQSSTDGKDLYLMVLEKDFLSLRYGTFFGGSVSYEHVDGGTSRFDKRGVVYHAVCAGCGGHSDFPTTSGAWSNTNNSTNCNLAAFKLQFDASGLSAGFAYQVTGVCAPFTVQFTDQSTGGTSWLWDFGDNTTSTLQSPAHLYTQTGTFLVTLIVYEPGNCNPSDTIYQEIILDGSNLAEFVFSNNNPCNYRVVFNSTTPGADFWFWDFGDSSSGSTLQNTVHDFPGPGVYTVMLIAGNASCSDTIYQQVILQEGPVADFAFSIDTCAHVVNFINLSMNETGYLWNFGDGNTSTDSFPTHEYPHGGDFTVTLEIKNNLNCSDEITKNIEIKGNFTNDIFVPNVFTPNSDGHFDLWKIESRNLEFYNLKVFDRWGALVFETSDPNAQWNGKINGSGITEDVYYYILELKDCLNNKNKYQGMVTLIR